MPGNGNKFQKSIHKPPELKKFLAISLALHIAAMTIQGLLPVNLADRDTPPPIKVSYVPPEPKAPPEKTATLIDAPKPRKIEAPRSAEFLSSFNSRAHSKKNRPPASKYRRKKTVVPKASGTASVPTRKRQQPHRKKSTTPRKRALQFPAAEKGFITSKPEEVPVETKDEPVPGSTLAMLDGFDPEKFASMDTNTPDEPETDDDDVISLDTQESKYASYFARIKHQIERVWNYPEEAARRGVSGQLTLKFRISRDGNLLDVRLMDASGSNLLDDAAVQAVKGAAPYYPFPVTIERETLSILATFIYSPTYSSQYQHRP